jgi:hypothetical protein
MVMMYWTRSLLEVWCCNIIYNACDCHPLLEYGTIRSFGFGSKGYNGWQQLKVFVTKDRQREQIPP